MKMVYDFFAKASLEDFNKENLEDKVREIWEKVYRKYKNKPNELKKEFEREFMDYIKSILDRYPLFLQSKLLRIYEGFEEDLRNFAETLKKEIKRKTYKPEIPSSKEVYKELILPEVKIKLDEPLLIESSNFSDSLPAYAIQIQITFKLKKPYLSKDDDNFYIIDNPIVKDKVFKVPMVRSTTWKGALRFAFKQICKDQKIEIRLFGNEKGETENFRQGRLFFYPTFFDRISLDVITPLDRETRTPARGPIYFEVVPKNAKGVFKVLYYPFDLIAKGDFDSIEEEVEEDLELLLKTIKKMFTETGFSAKKTSGFGVAEIENATITVGSGLEPYKIKIKIK
ncbi:MAG TPA: hypothetical protein DIT29_03930 [Pseudothermotoga sp.]|nr:hypothetical protein [Pseudothermotoga sp.]HCO97857.1 hypothetical protein [Pseudothermotoga sp.]